MAGAVMLGQVAALLDYIEPACRRCPRRGRLRLARLVAVHGPDFPVPALLAADCPGLRCPIGL